MIQTLLSVVFFVLIVLPARAEPPTLIPRNVIFGNPVKSSPEISPDGKFLSYLAPDEKNVLQVWVQTLGQDDARKVTADKKRGIRFHMWTHSPGILIYAQDNDGDENFHVYSVNVQDNKVQDLTPFPNVRAQPLEVHRDFPDELLVTLNKENPKLFDVYRINLATGNLKLDTKNPGDVVGWNTDPKFRVRICSSMTPDGGAMVRARADDKSDWKTIIKWGQEDVDGSVVDFTADGKSIWLITSEGRDTLGLVKRDLETGKETPIASDPGSDAGQVLVNPVTHEAEAVAFTREKRTWKPLNDKIAEDLAFLEKSNPGEASIVSADRDWQTWVVSYGSDIHPADYFLYDRATKKLTHLFSSRPELDKYELATMKPVTIKTRDGLDMICYLTVPKGVEPKNRPMVLDVHGGPWGRDRWGLHPEHQWLANRGYAVLSVNYRGSTGFGKKFLHAGDKEWAGKMHDDLIDAVRWAIDQGIADPKQIAIYGGSYGGYAALVGATFTPDVFACAVDIVGPSNLVTLLKSIPPYWEPMKKLFVLRVGDPDKDKEFLESRSPLFKADRIKIPMLIAQGAHDPRVKQAEAEQIVAAIRKAGKPVEYMLFPDEGHGFARPENRIKFYAAAENFLAKHLKGGRAEPAEKELSPK